ncbi:hypothetical protein [Frankia sp. CcWB2]
MGSVSSVSMIAGGWLIHYGHGRDETRGIKAATVAHLDFPHAAQAIRIHRWRRVKGRPATRETAYGITSLTFEQAPATLLALFARQHWHIDICSSDCTCE